MRIRHVVPVVAVCLLVLSGCSILTNPTFDAVLQAVIDIVVGQVLDKNPSSAQQIATDATALAQLAGGNTATVATLEAQADAVITASSLSVADKAALETVVAAAVALLQQEAAQAPATATASLQLVFTDIANAANLYASAKGQNVRAIIQR